MRAMRTLRECDVLPRNGGRMHVWCGNEDYSGKARGKRTTNIDGRRILGCTCTIPPIRPEKYKSSNFTLS